MNHQFIYIQHTSHTRHCPIHLPQIKFRILIHGMSDRKRDVYIFCSTVAPIDVTTSSRDWGQCPYAFYTCMFLNSPPFCHSKIFKCLSKIKYVYFIMYFCYAYSYTQNTIITFVKEASTLWNQLDKTAGGFNHLMCGVWCCKTCHWPCLMEEIIAWGKWNTYQFMCQNNVYLH